MKVANRISAIILGAALILTLCVSSARATKPPQIPAYVDEKPVTITVVTTNRLGVDQQTIASKVANPIYFVGYFTLDAQGDPVWVDLQPHVLSIGLGSAGYNPYWDIEYVEVDPSFSGTFTSEAQILASGIEPLDSGYILLCQQISK